MMVAAGLTVTLPFNPTRPTSPSMTPAVAFVEVKVREELWPAVIDVGFAVNVAVGAGVGFGNDPPPPVPFEHPPRRVSPKRIPANESRG